MPCINQTEENSSKNWLRCSQMEQSTCEHILSVYHMHCKIGSSYKGVHIQCMASVHVMLANLFVIHCTTYSMHHKVRVRLSCWSKPSFEAVSILTLCERYIWCCGCCGLYITVQSHFLKVLITASLEPANYTGEPAEANPDLLLDVTEARVK